MARVSLTVILAAILAVAGSPAAAAPPETVRTQFTLDTIVTIRAGGPKAEGAVSAAFAELRRVERLLSNFDPGSEIARVNAAAGVKPVPVTEETWRFLSEVRRQSRATGGAFDPTVGPLIKLWGFDGDRPSLPPRDRIKALLPLVGLAKVQFDREARTVYLPVKGMELDLGGALKGYAVDRAVEVLKAKGATYALVDAGASSIRVFGRRPGRRPWRIGIAHPRKPGAVLGVVELRDGEALGTSADGERYFVAEGRRYSHLLDPRTGWSARHNQLVSVKARSAFTADMLSKVFVLPTAEVLPLLTRLKLQGLAVGADGRVRTNLAGYRPAVDGGNR